MAPLRQRILDGERLNVFAVDRMFHPNVIHLGIEGGFDCFWMDVEHAGPAVPTASIGERLPRIPSSPPCSSREDAR